MKLSLIYKINVALYLIGITTLACFAVQNTFFSIFTGIIIGSIIWGLPKWKI